MIQNKDCSWNWALLHRLFEASQLQDIRSLQFQIRCLVDGLDYPDLLRNAALKQEVLPSKGHRITFGPPKGRFEGRWSRELLDQQNLGGCLR